MKTLKNLYEQLITEENIIDGLLNASAHKKHRREVQWSFRNVNEIIERTQRVFADDSYRFNIHEAKYVTNRVLRKNRYIVRPNFVVEQIVQHSIMNLLKDDMLNGMYSYSCGSLPDRGGLYGRNYLAKQIRKELKAKTDLYCLKMDVKHFFESIPIDRLFEALSSRYRDDRFLLQIKKVLNANVLEYNEDYFRVGLPIGYYTSQWFANWYLAKLDHYIKHVLKVKTYVRYVDDLVIVHRNKKELHSIFNKIEEFLHKIGLEAKSNWQVFKFVEYRDKPRTVRFIDFLGYKFYHNKVTLRKCILKSAKRKAESVYRAGRITYRDGQSLMSYYGYFLHADCKVAFEKYILAKVDLYACRKMVRRHQLKLNEQQKEKLAKYNKLKENSNGF